MPTARLYRKKDVYVAAAWPHYDSSPDWSLGLGWNVPTSATIRAFLEFDMADVPILAGSTINIATFNWRCIAAASTASPCTLNRLTRTDWLSDGDDGSGDWADWVHYQHTAALSWASAGGDYSTPTVSFNLPTATGWQPITCTAFIQDAQSNRGGIIEMLVRKWLEVGLTGAVYDSGNVSPASNRPYVEIDYTPPVVAGRMVPAKYWGA